MTHDEPNEEDEDRIPTLGEIPNCPTCGQRLTWIFWGDPAGPLSQFPEYRHLTDADALTYGGGAVPVPSARWECEGCRQRFFDDLTVDDFYEPPFRSSEESET